MPYLGILGNKSIKILLYLPSAFHAECKKLQLGTETAFFRLALKKLLKYMKSAPSNLPKCKISGKSTKL